MMLVELETLVQDLQGLRSSSDWEGLSAQDDRLRAVVSGTLEQVNGLPEEDGNRLRATQLLQILASIYAEAGVHLASESTASRTQATAAQRSLRAARSYLDHARRR